MTVSRLTFLFLCFRGRISRKSWWVGTLVLLAISVAIGWWSFPPLTDLEAMQNYQPPAWQRLLQIVFLVPALALTIKRLNDRDQPIWVGSLWCALMVLSIALDELGLLNDPPKLTTAEWAVLSASALFGVWVLIDNAFLKGTPGPNQYGPDPLGPPSQPPSGTLPRPGSGPVRRTFGAWVRDVLVGVAALVIGYFLLAPGPTLMGSLPRPEDLTTNLATGPTEEEMRANAPAWQAFNAGKRAADQDKAADAVVHYTRAIEHYGLGTQPAGRVQMWRGHAFRYLKQPAKALQDYSAAIALQPTWWHRYSYRARAYTALGRYDEALKDYDKAVGHWPDSPYDHIRRGNVLRTLGRTEEALRAYEKAIQVANREYDLSNRLNMISRLMGSGKADSRTSRFDKQIAWAQRERGKLLRDLGRFEQARVAFDKAIARTPDNAKLYSHRGWVLEKQTLLDAARADYERGLELAPDDAWLRRALKRVR